ncbi:MULTISPECIES: retropepsin-like aspartic protease [unclassified Pseudoalteromonas]|uniref:retropepsin-like aspartic protease n=1 Tax=unclassified Pseudoalteromonas TaxID=194690 RepID=UPI002097CA47|nr:retropepsin-like aspartic protease [Pseudoalteromonas sp. XMcav2-N]MCO7190971.1 retroviral-like aspartic protease family protein [Pseudoalteromonas sp. XMcav2-N]
MRVNSALLGLSLALNAYLGWQLYQSSTAVHPSAKVPLPAAPADAPGTSSDRIPVSLTQAQQAFQQGHYEQALAYLLQTYQTHPGATTRHAKQWWQWINAHLDQSSEAQLFAQLALVQGYLRIDPQALVVQRLEIRLYQSLQQPDEALTRLMVAYQSNPAYSRWQTLIDDLLVPRLVELKQQQKWHELLLLAAPWYDEKPQMLALLTYQIEAHLALLQPSEALFLIAQASDTLRHHQDVEALYNQAQALQQGVTHVPLRRLGSHFVLEAQLAGSTIELMIDTGASVTSLTQQQFAALDQAVEYLDTRTVSTANGLANVEFYQSEHMQVGDQIRGPMQFAVMNEMRAGPGLLGMNFLRHFDFDIDQRNAVLILRPRSQP